MEEPSGTSFLIAQFFGPLIKPTYGPSLARGGATILYVRVAKPPMSLLRIVDALGLALFSISGAQIAEQQGLSGIVIVTMGTLTGSAGGVIRDVLIGEIPLLFLQTETLYATASIAGISVYLTLKSFGVDRTISELSGMAVVAVLRLAAILWDLRLPAFKLPE